MCIPDKSESEIQEIRQSINQLWRIPIIKHLYNYVRFACRVFNVCLFHIKTFFNLPNFSPGKKTRLFDMWTSWTWFQREAHLTYHHHHHHHHHHRRRRRRRHHHHHPIFIITIVIIIIGLLLLLIIIIITS